MKAEHEFEKYAEWQKYCITYFSAQAMVGLLAGNVNRSRLDEKETAKEAQKYGEALFIQMGK